MIETLLNDIEYYFNIFIFTILFYGFVSYSYFCFNERISNITTEDILFIETILD